MKPEESTLDPTQLQLQPFTMGLMAKLKSLNWPVQALAMARAAGGQWCKERESLIWQQDTDDLGPVWCEATRDKFTMHVPKEQIQDA